MPPKKSIFRRPDAKHFQLVHRSLRDPLIYDSEASKYVLKQFERENVKKGISRTDLDSVLPASIIAHDKNRNIGEAALYGIYYDDTEYDYLQHLRTVGDKVDEVESILIEAPTKKTHKGKLEDSCIPQEALPSASELPRNYETQQAIPESIAGFQPDMDPHLRQVLQALEDDAFVDDDLTDDFFCELVGDGERGIEDVQFDFDEDGVAEDKSTLGDANKSSPAEFGWEQRFAQYKKSRARTEKDSSSDDGDSSEGGDTIGNLPTLAIADGNGKRRRKSSSDASGYSMSSSSMSRNETLQRLDEQFDQIMRRQYQIDDDDEEEPPLSSEEDTGEAPALITSREDFDAMVNEFLHDYEILGRRMKPKLEGNAPTDKLNTIRRAFGQDDRMRTKGDNDDKVQDIFAVEDTQREDRWDCETILTTYSNLENHPRIIRVDNPKLVPKISLDPKTGFPLPNDMTSKIDDDHFSKNTTVKQNPSRVRNESKEEKNARKAAAKLRKQNRRAEKRATKELFEAELKAQKRVMPSKNHREKKL